MHAGLLFAAGNRNIQCIRYRFGLLIPIERHRFFVKIYLVILQDLSDPDSFLDVVRAVGIGIDGHAVGEL